MSVQLTNNQILITDADGQLKFDTDQHMLFAPEFHAGSITIPARGVDAREAIEVIHPIADVNPLSNRVFGVFRATVDAYWGQVEAPGLGWFAAGGTYFHNGHGNLQYTNDPYYPGSSFFETCSLYTFRIEAGKLELYEQVQISGVASTGQEVFLQSQFTLDYRIWTCRFDV